jgi:hypothetical protein
VVGLRGDSGPASALFRLRESANAVNNAILWDDSLTVVSPRKRRRIADFRRGSDLSDRPPRNPIRKSIGCETAEFAATGGQSALRR